MATETLYSTHGMTDIVVAGVSKAELQNHCLILRTNGTDIQAGYAVTQVSETYPDVDLCADGEVPTGIAWKYARPADIPANWTVDVAFADNKHIYVIPFGLGLGVVVACFGQYHLSTAARKAFTLDKTVKQGKKIDGVLEPVEDDDDLELIIGRVWGAAVTGKTTTALKSRILVRLI
jgi:hypothetical protein